MTATEIKEDIFPDIVGIATEPLLSDPSEGRSEDLLYAEQPEWMPQLIADLEKDQENFDVLRPERVTVRFIAGDEYPDPPKRSLAIPGLTGQSLPMNRQQRRAARAKARRKY